MHRKRLSAKLNYPLERKGKKRFVFCPRPGPHKKDESIPLASLLRDVLKYCENAKEAKHVIKAGKITVDGKVRKDHKYPVGIFDVVGIPEINEYYVIVPGEKWFKLVKTEKKDVKICRIENKTKVKGGKTQLNLYDGKNILVDEDVYKTGDSILVSLPDLKIKKHIKKEKGCLCLIIKGSRKGKVGRLKEIKKIRGPHPNLASVEIDQSVVEVPEKFVFVIGEKSPEIDLGD